MIINKVFLIKNLWNLKKRDFINFYNIVALVDDILSSNLSTNVYTAISKPTTFVLKQYIYIYIYIYIYTNLISTSIPGYKKKKIRQEQEVKISRITARGKKKKYYRTKKKKKRKGQPRHTSWKKSRDMQSVGQKKTKTPVNAAMLQLQECSTRVEPIIN